MIKQISLILAVLFVVGIQTKGISQFTDDFSDGDFTNNPTWTGNTIDFQVSTGFELQLNAPATTNTSYLVTNNQAIGNAQYDFNVRLDFNPSTSNYARVYLVSSSNNLLGSLNGYFVQIGGASGTLDDVSLYYQNGTAATKIINGTNGTVALNPNVDVRVTRDMNGNWELLIDTALNGTFISEGTIFHNLTTTSSYFGVFCDYTSTRSTKFFFDNFVVTGGPVMDIDPPVLDSTKAISATEVDVYFNEYVDLTTSQLISNYAVNNGIGSPTSAIRDATDSSVVHLTFSSSIPNNTYTLSVINVEDLAGNAIGLETVNFVINFVTPSQYGDVVINEIFADPTPVVGLPDAEFIELTNNTSSTINLFDWVYGDASTRVALPSYSLAPSAYVILCNQADTALFTAYGSVLGLPSWPTLNNGGDFLGLRDATNTLIDTVNYTSAWYKDANKANGGWTLERINPTAICSDANNWIASNNPSGGTPGTQNSVFNNQPDLSLPQVESFAIIAPNRIEITLSKAIDSNTVSTTSFSMDQSITVTQTTTPTFQTIWVDITPNLVDSIVYQLSITGISDCYGNAITDTLLSIAIGKSPNIGDLIFNEIYPNPTLDNPLIPNAEYVEIYNVTDYPISLNGLTFADQSTTVNLPNAVILPNQYAILVEDIHASGFMSYGYVISLTSWPSLNNSGDLITLANSNYIIDQLLYSDTWYNNNDKKSGGWSIELINPKTTCTGKLNWTGSENFKQATPGKINSVFDSLFTVNFELLSATAISENQVELVFSKTIDQNALIPSNFIWSNAITSTNVVGHPTEQNIVYVSVSPDFETGEEYTVTALNILDCRGNHLQDSTALIGLPSAQDMLINEVLFNPNTGGSDYVELYNTSNKNIDLKNWSLLYFNNSGDSAYKVISTDSYIVKPNTFIVLTEDSANIKFEYTNHGEGTFLTMDLPTYSNAEGVVTVLNQMGLVNDEFAYNEDMHLEIITDVKGVSLERINYNLGLNSSNNWHSAASTSGYGTPGIENSQYLNEEARSSEVTVSPKTFSPNNDGYQDVTSIHYNFDTSGFIATVSIHNDQGQLINTLVNNQSVDTTGEIIWDGTNDNNEIMPTGMYIVMFKVFNLDNEQHVYKNVVVLAMP